MVQCKKIFLFSTCLLIFLVICQVSNGAQRLCGKALSDQLSIVCRGGYNSRWKRSLDMDDYTDNEIDDGLPYPYANLPFVKPIHGAAADLMAKTRRRRRGIYDLCCRKACSIREMLDYCN